MAALDFPPTPAVGTLYPLVAEVGKPQYRWNGSEWTAATFDPAGYVRKSGDSMSGALSLAGDPTQALHAVPKQYLDARWQRISLAGGKSFDIQVPAGAISARVSGVISSGTATNMLPLIQVSVSPGVFFAQGDYRSYGYYNKADNLVIGVSAGQYGGFFICDTHGNAATSVIFTGTIILKRSSTAVTIMADIDGFSYAGALGAHSHFMTYVNTAHATLDVLALRILSTTGDNWTSTSHVNIEWVF